MGDPLQVGAVGVLEGVGMTDGCSAASGNTRGTREGGRSNPSDNQTMCLNNGSLTAAAATTASDRVLETGDSF